MSDPVNIGPIDLEENRLRRRSRGLRKFSPGTLQRERFLLAKEAISVRRSQMKQVPAPTGDSDLVSKMRRYIAQQNEILSQASPDERLGLLFPGSKPIEESLNFVKRNELAYQKAFSKGLVQNPTEFWTKVRQSGGSPQEWIANQSLAFNPTGEVKDQLLSSQKRALNIASNPSPRITSTIAGPRKRPLYRYDTVPNKRIKEALPAIPKSNIVSKSLLGLQRPENLIPFMMERGRRLAGDDIRIDVTNEIQDSRARKSAAVRRATSDQHLEMGTSKIFPGSKERTYKQAIKKTVSSAKEKAAQGVAESSLLPKLDFYVSQGVKEAQAFEKMGAIKRAAPYAAGVIIATDVLSSKDKTGPFWGLAAGGLASILLRRAPTIHRLYGGLIGYGVGRFVSSALSRQHDPPIEGFGELGESSIGRKQLTDFGSGWQGLRKTVEVVRKALPKTIKQVIKEAPAAPEKHFVERWYEIYQEAQKRGEAQKAIIKQQQEQGIYEKLLPSPPKIPFTPKGIQRKVHRTQEFSEKEVGEALSLYAKEKGIQGFTNLWEIRSSVKALPIKNVNVPVNLPESLAGIGSLKTIAPGSEDIGRLSTMAPGGEDIGRLSTMAPGGEDIGRLSTMAPGGQDIGRLSTMAPGGDIGSLKTMAPGGQDIGSLKTMAPGGDIGKLKTLLPDMGVRGSKSIGLQDTLSAGGNRPHSINELASTLDAPVSAFSKTMGDPLADTIVPSSKGKTNIGSLPTLSPSQVESSVAKFGRNYNDFANSSPHGSRRRKNHPKVLESFTSFGMAGTLRKETTDFGTGWDPARRLASVLFSNAVKAGQKTVARGKAFKKVLRSEEFQEALARGKVVNKLGEGGIGSVELLETEISGKKFRYARKSYSESVGKASPEELMEGEIKGLRAIQSSIGPTPYGRGKVVKKGREIPVMYFEALEGFDTASKMVPMQGGFTKKQVSDLWDAVDTLHKKGLAHADIKPANILMNKEGKLALIDPFPDRFEFSGWGAVTDTQTVNNLQKSQDLLAMERIAKGGNTQDMLRETQRTSNALAVTSFYSNPNSPFTPEKIQEYLPAAQEIYKRAGAERVAEVFNVPMVARKRTQDLSQFPGGTNVLKEASVSRTGAASPKALGDRTGAASPKAMAERTGAASPRALENRTGAASPYALADKTGAASPKALADRTGAASPGALRSRTNAARPLPVEEKTGAASPQSMARRKMRQDQLYNDYRKREQLHQDAIRTATFNNTAPAKRHRTM